MEITTAWRGFVFECLIKSQECEIYWSQCGRKVKNPVKNNVKMTRQHNSKGKLSREWIWKDYTSVIKPWLDGRQIYYCFVFVFCYCHYSAFARNTDNVAFHLFLSVVLLVLTWMVTWFPLGIYNSTKQNVFIIHFPLFSRPLWFKFCDLFDTLLPTEIIYQMGYKISLTISFSVPLASILWDGHDCQMLGLKQL